MPKSFWKRLFKVFLVFFLLFMFPGGVKAWGGDVHSYLCPGSYDCSVADSREFMTTYEWDSFGHLCIDNQPDCLSRLGAKYFLKRYYLEGKQDWKLLAAAAHLYQDATCPDHWYPMREYLGKIFVPFAPEWVSKTESRVSRGFSYRPGPEGYNDGWNIPIKWKGQDININKAFFDSTKSSLQNFVSKEPQEDIDFLRGQIAKKKTLTLFRSYKEVAYLATLVVFPIWIYTFWVYKKKNKKSDFLIASVILAVLAVYFIFIKIFW